MELTLFNSIAALGYLIASVLLWLRLIKKVDIAKSIILSCAIIAVVAHGYVLHHWIDLVSGGQNLTLPNIVSMIFWLSAVLLTIASLRKPVENLGIFCFPLAALSIGIALLFPGNHIIYTAANPKQLVHILLSIFTFSVLGIAALQALLLWVQEYSLRHKRSIAIIQALPPLETMETLLFQIIWLGFILLSAVLFTSLMFFKSIFSPLLLNKTILAIIAWLIFALLLFGRYYFGWRGRTAIRWTLAGVIFLILSYFSGRLLVELLI